MTEGKKTIVVSAVNLRKGGTLTILKDCLEYLSSSGMVEQYRVVALVHDRNLCDYPGIEYIEIPQTVTSWLKRLWCEYVTMRGISKRLAPVYLWLSLHDTTPNVEAQRRAVYCHNPFPFYAWKWRELFLNYKIVLFAWFSKWIYRINIHKNYKVIVQQNWIREEFKRMFGIKSKDIIIAKPPQTRQNLPIPDNTASNKVPQFMFASFSDVHKNFETLLQASHLLENELGKGRFKVVVTIDKQQNKYASWLWSKWGDPSSASYTDSVEWTGFLDRATLYDYYSKTDCLVFPSKVETWGLPISEFMASGKPMILSDLPYAHETASGYDRVKFFNSMDARDLAKKMKDVVEGGAKWSPVPEVNIEKPSAADWSELFRYLI